MSRDRLRTDLMLAEGTGPMRGGRFLPYWDCCGKPLRECNCNPRFQGRLTIAYGRNLEDNGLTLREGDLLLENDIDNAIKDLTAKYGQAWFLDLNAARQAVCVEMVFNLGIERFSKFRRMIAAIGRGDFETAAVEALSSRWADQVGQRARRLAEQLRRGSWA